MSIVERAAKLLGPIEDGQTEQGSASTSSSPDDLSFIERAIDAKAEPPDHLEPIDHVGRTKVETLATESRSRITTDLQTRTARTHATLGPGKPLAGSVRSEPAPLLRVDRDQLRLQSLMTPDGARTPIAECFRLIKSQILTKARDANASPPANLVMVTSSQPGEGKTFCAINLAISMALEKDVSVLLVDTDVARPSVPRVLGLEKLEQGLMDVLDCGIDVAKVMYKTDIGKLTLLPAGTQNQHATELLSSDAMRVLLRELAERYHDRIVIFDSPPLLAASEAAVLASHMGQIVVVVEADRTSERLLEEALDRIESSRITGLVLNKG